MKLFDEFALKLVYFSLSEVGASGRISPVPAYRDLRTRGEWGNQNQNPFLVKLRFELLSNET